MEGSLGRGRVDVHDEADQCVLGKGDGKGVEVRVVGGVWEVCRHGR
jgi:hypothetical protein